MRFELGSVFSLWPEQWSALLSTWLLDGFANKRGSRVSARTWQRGQISNVRLGKASQLLLSASCRAHEPLTVHIHLMNGLNKNQSHSRLPSKRHMKCNSYIYEQFCRVDLSTDLQIVLASERWQDITNPDEGCKDVEMPLWLHAVLFQRLPSVSTGLQQLNGCPAAKHQGGSLCSLGKYQEMPTQPTVNICRWFSTSVTIYVSKEPPSLKDNMLRMYSSYHCLTARERSGQWIRCHSYKQRTETMTRPPVFTGRLGFFQYGGVGDYCTDLSSSQTMLMGESAQTLVVREEVETGDI